MKKISVKKGFNFNISVFSNELDICTTATYHTKKEEDARNIHLLLKYHMEGIENMCLLETILKFLNVECGDYDNMLQSSANLLGSIIGYEPDGFLRTIEKIEILYSPRNVYLDVIEF